MATNPYSFKKIDDVNDRKSKFGLIKKKIAQASTITEIYCVSDRTKIVQGCITISNVNTTTATTVRVWISSEELPTDIDVIEPKISLAAEDVFVRHPLWISPGERIYVLSMNTDVTVRIDGYDERAV
jgi:hypothetical protein